MDAILQPDSPARLREQGHQGQSSAGPYGAEPARQHLRFQFDRLDDWKRQELLQKQQRQAQMRDLLEEQVRAKQEREREQKAQIEREDAEISCTPRDRTSFACIGLNSARKARPSPRAISNNQHCHDETKHQDQSNDTPFHSESIAKTEDDYSMPETRDEVDNEVVDEAFSRKFQWKQDEILEKQRKQRALRQSLQEQLREKEERSRQPTPQTNATSMALGRNDASSSDEIDPSGKLFTWKQEAILNRRREQEKTRRLLEEQIEEKRKAKRKQQQRQQQRDEEETAQDSLNNFRDDPDPVHPASARSANNVDETVPRSPQPKEKHTEASKTEIDDELDALRQQVEQQKQLLREQSELMQEMQRQNISPKASTAREADKPVRERGKKANSDKCGATNDSATKPKRAKAPRERKSNRQSLARAAPKSQTLRECTLRRNTAGRFCIEVEPVLDAYCLVKRVGKSHVKDKRGVLQTGDLVVALGAFAVRQARKRLASMQDDSLRAIMTSLDLPTFDEVTTVLAKGGNLVTFAVFTANRDDVLGIAEDLLDEEEEAAEEEARAQQQQQQHQQQHHMDFNAAPETFQEMDHDFDLQDRGYRAKHDDQEDSHASRTPSHIIADASFDADDLGELRASSTFVRSDEWATFDLNS